MNGSHKTRQQLLIEGQELSSRMIEAEETLRAILGGEVDGLVVSTAEGDRIFTLSGADLPYRIMVETMNEGAVTITSDGTVFFCNQRFADIVAKPLETVQGSSIYQYISSGDLQAFEALLEQGLKSNSRMELALQTGGERDAPVLVSLSALQQADLTGALCMVVTDLTEQKRNEKLLAEEKLTTQILKQVEEIFVLCDNQGRIIRTSTSTDRRLGRSPIFQEFDEAFHLLYPDGNPFVLLSAMNGAFLHGLEVCFHQGKDSCITFLLSATPVSSSQGIIGIVVVLVDITERTKAEAKIAHLASFPQLNPNPVIETDMEKRVIFSNDAAMRFLRKSNIPEDVNLFLPRDLNEIIKELQQGNTGQYVLREVAINGSIFIETIILPANMEIVRIYAQNISERKKMEVQLFETNQRLQALMDALPVGVSFSDGSDCQRITGNPNVLKQFEVNPEDNLSASAPDTRAPGRQIRFFMEGREIRDTELPLQRAVAENRNIPPMELEVALPSGRRWFAMASGSPIRDKEGNAISGIAVTVDITERKNIELALQKAHDTLEHKVTERTAELRTALSAVSLLKDQIEAENIYFRQEHKMKNQFENILGQSDGLKYVLFRAEQVAPSNTTVLILGETGTGKELIAAAIHNMSPRKERPLFTVNCAALPGNLIESELFGREKGAFTGADSRRIGRFEVAHGSTLCLDEIGELPLELQGKLLRVIQHNEFERLGSSQTIKVDVRLVATTNRNLEEEVRKGRFRQDLFYRLNVFPITVPPLRQRKDDIPLMVQVFTERYSRKLGKQITTIHKQTMKTLQEYPWPGNVRELESIIERAVILCPGPVLHLADKLEISTPVISSAVETLEETERNQILKILSENKWHIEGKNGSAVILGLHPSTLRARMHKLGIIRPETK